MSINLTHPTIVHQGHLNEVLENKEACPFLLTSLDMTPAQRSMRAGDLDNKAIGHGKAIFQKTANLLRTLSVMDIAAIKKHLAAA